jgi:hypothetical protein
MIQRLELTQVGPTDGVDFSFAPRLNVITGDNGLGKTFVLDVLWWVLTNTWAGEKAFPFRPLDAGAEGNEGRTEDSSGGVGPGSTGNVPTGGAPDNETKDRTGSVGAGAMASIWSRLANREADSADEKIYVMHAIWQWGTQEWRRKSERLAASSVMSSNDSRAEHHSEFGPETLVVYARVDGSYAVFDSIYASAVGGSGPESAMVLSASDLWDGKDVVDVEVQGGRRTLIAGLIADWVAWQQRPNSREFELLRKILYTLSSPDEPLIPGVPTRVHLRDRRDIPTIATSWGVVPVTLASAGMKRALSLAYLMVWAWVEHEKAAKVSRRASTRDVVVLVDEPELHQHPTWQRTFMPAVLKAVSMLAPNAGVQVFAATHSPLVLASLENIWSEPIDDLFVLERNGKSVCASELGFVLEGDATNWLASRVFGNVSARSRAGELAIEAAQHFMAERTDDAEATLSLLDQHMADQPKPPVADTSLTLLSIPVSEEADGQFALARRVDEALQRTLPGHDEFWVHWTLVYRR